MKHDRGLFGSELARLNSRPVRGDQDFVKEMLEFFVTTSPSFRDALKRSITDGDFESAMSNLHRLKGDAGIVHATELYSHLNRLEQSARTDRKNADNYWDLEAERLFSLYIEACKELAGLPKKERFESGT